MYLSGNVPHVCSFLLIYPLPHSIPNICILFWLLSPIFSMALWTWCPWELSSIRPSLWLLFNYFVRLFSAIACHMSADFLSVLYRIPLCEYAMVYPFLAHREVYVYSSIFALAKLTDTNLVSNSAVICNPLIISSIFVC